MFKKAWGIAISIWDWYLRLEWLGRLIIGLGFGAGLLSSAGAFWAALAQGITPLYAIFLALFALLFAVLVALGIMEITGTRKPPKHIHHHNATVQLGGVEAKAETGQRSVRTDKLQTAMSGANPLVPDWHLRELFAHLSPGILSSKDRRTFDSVAAEITDKLSTGQIISWGRAIHRSRTLPLFLIPEDYWLHAKLNIWLLDDDGGNILQAAPVDVSAPNKTQYSEILINQAQALAEWPDRFVAPNKAPDYIPLPAAAKRILEASLTNLLGVAAMREPTPERRLNYVGIYIAYTKGVRLFGQRPPLDVKEAVPREHMGRYRMEGATELYVHGGNGPTYVALSVLSSDLDAVWQELVSNG
jgi:hypothetical protein